MEERNACVRVLTSVMHTHSQHTVEASSTPSPRP